MYSVASLLDGHHRAAVAQLWEELDSRLIRQGFCPMPYPHISFHVAEGYDLVALRQAMQRAAASSAPLVVRTSGLGVFRGEAQPVIYLTVVRDAALSEFHSRVWKEAESACIGSNLHYEPSNWVPHITLAQGEMLRERVAETIALLWHRDFNWEIEIDSLSLIYDDGMRQGVEMSFDMTGTL